MTPSSENERTSSKLMDEAGKLAEYRYTSIGVAARYD